MIDFVLRRFRQLAIVAILSAVASPFAYAAPQITSLSPRAIAPNGDTDLTIVAKNITPNSKLMFAQPGITSQIIGDVKNDRITFRVTTNNVPTDFYSVRVVDESGISNPLHIACDNLPLASAQQTIASIPASIEGALTGSKIDKVTFQGEAGKRIVVGVEARRLGSKLMPVARLYDPRGTQIAWSPPQANLQGDARCEATLPVTGVYSIELHDRTYRGAAPGFYRLKIGDFRAADFAYPTGLQRAVATELTWLARSGNKDLLGVMTVDRPAGIWPSPIVSDHKLSGGVPAVYITDYPQFTEAASDVLPAPAAVSGIISAAGETDQYRFTVEPGKKYRATVISADLGTSLDGVLAIKTADGKGLATNDDQPDLADPMATFQAPKGVTEVVASLTDLAGRGGSDYLYRLTVEPAQPKWRVETDQAEIMIPIGGRTIVALSEIGRPPASETSVSFIPPFDNQFTLMANAWKEASQLQLVVLAAEKPFEPFVGHLGAATENRSTAVEVTGRSQADRAWLGREIAVAPIAKKIGVDWASADKMVLPAGGSIRSLLKIQRESQIDGPIRLRLISSQQPPQKTIKQKNKDVQVPDEARTLRLIGETVAPAGSAEAAIEIAVPAELSAAPHHLAVVAELLSSDKKTVLARSATAVAIAEVTHPIRLTLAGKPNVNATAGEGETGSIKGAIVRSEGYVGPVTISLTGLAKEYPSPTMVIAPDATEFTLPVRFPAGAKPADLSGVRLLASLKSQDATFVSNAVPLAVKVVAAKPK